MAVNSILGIVAVDFTGLILDLACMNPTVIYMVHTFVLYQCLPAELAKTLMVFYWQLP
jgi:hypothetical protein